MFSLKRFTLLFLALLALSLSACYTVTLDARSSDTAISMNNPGQKATKQHFRLQLTSHHIIYGLIEISEPDIADEIKKQVRSYGGTEAVNVFVKTEHSFLDGFLNWLTGGIYNPVTVIIEGDVVGAA